MPRVGFARKLHYAGIITTSRRSWSSPARPDARDAAAAASDVKDVGKFTVPGLKIKRKKKPKRLPKSLDVVRTHSNN